MRVCIKLTMKIIELISHGPLNLLRACYPLGCNISYTLYFPPQLFWGYYTMNHFQLILYRVCEILLLCGPALSEPFYFNCRVLFD